MNEFVDILSPNTIGEDKIVITVDPSSFPLQVGRSITLLFDYGKTLPAGVTLPLDLTVQSGSESGEGFQQVRFDRYLPEAFAIQVSQAGQYLVLLKETGHNFWQGRILLTVAGDSYQITSRST